MEMGWRREKREGWAPLRILGLSLGLFFVFSFILSFSFGLFSLADMGRRLGSPTVTAGVYICICRTNCGESAATLIQVGLGKSLTEVSGHFH